MKPIISVLIPTRNRMAYLCESAVSFFEKADDPARIEMLVRVHASDNLSQNWVSRSQLPIRMIVGDDADGYLSIHRFVNCMAAMARGDWLWAGSDDAKIISPGWDTELLKASENPKRECLLVNPHVEDLPNWKIPVLSRGLYDAIGTCGETAHCDCYLDALTHFAGIQRRVPIQVYKWPNLPWCASRDLGESWKEYRSHESAERFNLDKIKLGAVLGKDLGKWTTSDAPEKPYP